MRDTMEEKTKNLLKVGGGALLYYLAAREAHKPFKGPLEGFFGSKAEAIVRGPAKLLWGLIANEGLRGLGVADNEAFGWTVLGALGVEWYVISYKTKFVSAASISSPVATGWDEYYAAGDKGVTVLPPPPPRTPVTYTPAYMPQPSPVTYAPTYMPGTAPANYDFGPGF